MERLKRWFGLSAEEDPLKKEVEEARRLAEKALKESEKLEKLEKKAKGRKAGGSEGGLLKASEKIEEDESIFSGLQ